MNKLKEFLDTIKSNHPSNVTKIYFSRKSNGSTVKYITQSIGFRRSSERTF